MFSFFSGQIHYGFMVILSCATFELFCAFRRGTPKLGMAKVTHVDFPPRETVSYTKETQTPVVTQQKEGDSQILLHYYKSFFANVYRKWITSGGDLSWDESKGTLRPRKTREVKGEKNTEPHRQLRFGITHEQDETTSDGKEKCDLGERYEALLIRLLIASEACQYGCNCYSEAFMLTPHVEHMRHKFCKTCGYAACSWLIYVMTDAE